MVDHIRRLGVFPANYALDLGEFIDSNGNSYIDIVELNPISCSMCYVNNSIYADVVPEIGECQRQLMMGAEFCYDAIANPKDYDTFKAQIGRMENMGYYKPDDCFICKNGRHLDYVSKYTSHAKDGTEREISVYRCEDCSDCPYRSVCCKAKEENRRKEISVCWEFQKMRQQSYRNITTEEGKLLRCNRSIQVEGAFGQLKHNRSFKRFLTGGNIKVLAELLFLGLSQNIAHFVSKCNSSLQKQHLIQPKAYLKF